MTREQLRGLAAHARAIRGLVQHAAKLRARGEVVDLDVLLLDVERHAVEMGDELAEVSS
jgi:hypothetical protein